MNNKELEKFQEKSREMVYVNAILYVTLGILLLIMFVPVTS